MIGKKGTERETRDRYSKERQKPQREREEGEPPKYGGAGFVCD